MLVKTSPETKEGPLGTIECEHIRQGWMKSVSIDFKVHMVIDIFVNEVGRNSVFVNKFDLQSVTFGHPTYSLCLPQ